MTVPEASHQQPDSFDSAGNAAAKRAELLSADQADPSDAESPQNLPPKAWITLVMFAAFVVLFGTCANFFLFD